MTPTPEQIAIANREATKMLDGLSATIAYDYNSDEQEALFIGFKKGFLSRQDEVDALEARVKEVERRLQQHLRNFLKY